MRSVRISFIAVAAVGALTLAACSGSADTASPVASATPTAVASASATEAAPGSDPAVWAPKMLRKKTKTVELVSRQIAVWPALAYDKNPDLTIVTSDPLVVDVLPADSGTVVGFVAVAPGEAVVRVYKTPDTTGKPFRKVTVTVIG